ncbi:MBL fold metallo-hydrolase [Myxococcus sp. K38C18041901]|uniref:MBL fold metallo-hydrolase n=1 Tax=Myxococcus guangdongensis TaxID=2906760 RepID=UPI0020A7A0C0|nr:MBL fold metallo-hydrolase [Myxococcus guangdongensis]MCP3062654.1 MBL fold metallo-hydrolase [Myxococcus guangdongensis]
MALSASRRFVASLLLVTPVVTLAAPPPQVRTSSPGYYRMMLGDFEITALSDGTVTLPADTLLTNITPAEVKARLGRLGIDPGRVEASINAFLVHTGEHLVLVDTGSGTLFGPTMGGRLLSSLRAAGYQPEDIDAVLLTHIHGDHSCGLTLDGKPSFPNATVHVEQREADFWLDASHANHVAKEHHHGFQEAAAAFAPYLAAGRVKRFSGDTELFPGIRTLATPGHTPGHAFYVVESQGRQLRFWGDLIHAQDVQFPSPGVTIRFDLDSTAAARQRRKAMSDAAAKGYLVAAPHISFPGIGRVLADGKGFAWAPVHYSVAGLSP